jgi:hypothetical protein
VKRLEISEIGDLDDDRFYLLLGDIAVKGKLLKRVPEWARTHMFSDDELEAMFDRCDAHYRKNIIRLNDTLRVRVENSSLYLYDIVDHKISRRYHVPKKADPEKFVKEFCDSILLMARRGDELSKLKN